MNLVNLLAFFQIAVAFDFGLLFLSRTHIFTSLHTALQRELNDRCEEMVVATEIDCEVTANTQDENVIRQRVYMGAKLNKLYNHLSPRNAIWNKYSYIGLFSGIYGLLCLFLIGMAGCQKEMQISQFLLISGEVTILFELRSLIQIGKSSDKPISTLRIGKRLLGLVLCYVLALGCAWNGIYIRVFNDFETPFLVLSIAIVYMPVLVYLFRIIVHLLKFMYFTSECEIQHILLRNAMKLRRQL
ncbi:MAG: hypothetical protein HDS84_00070 [Bacteroidales bacterium]|nr:hypothetical protein [Bacteroidales bacterium]